MLMIRKLVEEISELKEDMKGAFHNIIFQHTKLITQVASQQVQIRHLEAENTRLQAHIEEMKQRMKEDTTKEQAHFDEMKERMQARLGLMKERIKDEKTLNAAHLDHMKKKNGERQGAFR